MPSSVAGIVFCVASWGADHHADAPSFCRPAQILCSASGHNSAPSAHKLWHRYGTQQAKPNAGLQGVTADTLSDLPPWFSRALREVPDFAPRFSPNFNDRYEWLDIGADRPALWGRTAVPEAGVLFCRPFQESRTQLPDELRLEAFVKNCALYDRRARL